MNNIDYSDVYVVDTFDETEQFFYKHNNKPVEVGTAVGYDTIKTDPITKHVNVVLQCFEGIYFND